MKDIIAKRLRDIMNEKNVNQVELAKAICVGQSTVSSWPSAKKAPRLISLWKLADYFDVSVDYFVGRADF